MSGRRSKQEELEALRRQVAELEAKLGGAGERAISGGRDMRGVFITGDGNVVGNVYVGPAVEDDEGALRAYREVLVASCSDVPLRAVHPGASDPTGRQERVDLAAIYVDLDTRTQISMRVERPKKGKHARIKTNETNFVTRSLRALEAVAKNRSLVLLGDPGSGKSTFVNHVTLCLAAHVLHPERAWLRRVAGWSRGAKGLLPVPVLLRDFARSIPEGAKQAEVTHLWDFIVARLKAQNLGEAARPIERALDRGEALVLLDGLDEVPTNEQRSFVRDAVVAFSKRYAKSDYLVTCRTLSYQDPAWKLPGVPAFELSAFDEAKIDGFIAAWYGELEKRGEVPAGESPELVRRLQEAVRRPDLEGLAPNPLLLTVMAIVHAHKGRLPEARALLYEETVEILLWRWDDIRTRRLRNLMETAGVTEIDLKRVLWRLAFEAQASVRAEAGGGLADIQERQIEKALIAVHPRGDRNWAHDLVEAMKLRAGILIERTAEVYTFPHRTFQEYLAGVHLSAQGDFTKQAFERLQEGALWREVVLLAVGRMVHTSGDTDRPLVLVSKLCPGKGGDSLAGWRNAWMAGEILLELGLHRVKESDLGVELLERVRGRLRELVEKGRLSAIERVRAGDALGRLGDPRFREDAWGLPQEELLGFVKVAAGPFLMGSDPEKDKRREWDDEKPQHTVNLEDYYIGRYPVTVEQFAVFVQDKAYTPGNPESLRGVPNHPVVYIAWEEANAYAAWLTEKLRMWKGTPEPLALLLRNGRSWSFTLASEAEWEKAARGTDGRIYPWGDELDFQKANYADTRIGRTSAVGCFPEGKSPYRCEDMSGNVLEWTRNRKESYPYQANSETIVSDETMQYYRRVARGGAFDNSVRDMRCTVRGNFAGAGRFVGFRVVLSPFPP